MGAASKAKHEGAEAFHVWVHRSLQQGTKRLNRWASVEGQPPPPIQAVEHNGEYVSTPEEGMTWYCGAGRSGRCLRSLGVMGN